MRIRYYYYDCISQALLAEEVPPMKISGWWPIRVVKALETQRGHTQSKGDSSDSNPPSVCNAFTILLKQSFYTYILVTREQILKNTF